MYVYLIKLSNTEFHLHTQALPDPEINQVGS